MNFATSSLQVAEGELVAGKYRVERVLGEGGMGVVVAARHIELDELVAIKFLLPHALGNPDVVSRFAREARAAVKIKSQHVARTLDVGKLDSGAPYIVMEHLSGMDLSTRLSRGGVLEVEEAVNFALQTCEALADAHAIGIIHRDLKPANLFVVRGTDGSDCVKVLDFGISKLTRAADGSTNMSMTSTATVMGSPLYMSPEQMASARNADARSDIWSLGTTLYELLAGKPPFMADTITELCSQVLTQPAPSLRSRRPELPGKLEAVIARCLEKDPANRYPNVAELALALAEFAPRRARHSAERAARVLAAAGVSQSALELPPSTTPTPAASAPNPGGTVASWGQTAAPQHRRFGLVFTALGLVALLATLGALLVRLRSSGPDSSAAATVTPALSTGLDSLAISSGATAVAPSVTAVAPSVTPVAINSANSALPLATSKATTDASNAPDHPSVPTASNTVSNASTPGRSSSGATQRPSGAPIPTPKPGRQSVSPAAHAAPTPEKPSTAAPKPSTTIHDWGGRT